MSRNLIAILTATKSLTLSLLLITATASLPASASPILTAAAVAGQNIDTSSATAGVVTASAADASSDTGLFQASDVEVRSTFGQLGVLANASAFSDSIWLPQAVASGTAGWTDDFIITSDVYGDGTVGAFLLTAGLSGTFLLDDIVASQFAQGGAGGQAQMQLLYDCAIIMVLERNLLTDGLGGTYCTLCGSLPAAGSTTLLLPVGTTFTITQLLGVTASVDHLASGIVQSAFLDTAWFTLSPLESGFGYISASGTDYQTQLDPVPEPGTLVLMTTGLGLAAGRSWRRRRGDS